MIFHLGLMEFHWGIFDVTSSSSTHASESAHIFSMAMSPTSREAGLTVFLYASSLAVSVCVRWRSSAVASCASANSKT